MFCTFQNIIVHRSSFPLNLKSDANNAKQLHLFCLELEWLFVTFPITALLVTNLYKQLCFAHIPLYSGTYTVGLEHPFIIHDVLFIFSMPFTKCYLA